MEKTEKTNYVVYVLRNKNNKDEVYYVGMSGEFENRRYQHMNMYVNSTKDWIKEVGTGNVECVKVYEFTDKQSAALKENELINEISPILNTNKSGLCTKDIKEYSKVYYGTQEWKDYFKRYNSTEEHKQAHREACKRYNEKKRLECCC